MEPIVIQSKVNEDEIRRVRNASLNDLHAEIAEKRQRGLEIIKASDNAKDHPDAHVDFDAAAKNESLNPDGKSAGDLKQEAMEIREWLNMAGTEFIAKYNSESFRNSVTQELPQIQHRAGHVSREVEKAMAGVQPGDYLGMAFAANGSYEEGMAQFKEAIQGLKNQKCVSINYENIDPLNFQNAAVAAQGTHMEGSSGGQLISVDRPRALRDVSIAYDPTISISPKIKTEVVTSGDTLTYLRQSLMARRPAGEHTFPTHLTYTGKAAADAKSADFLKVAQGVWDNPDVANTAIASGQTFNGVTLTAAQAAMATAYKTHLSVNWRRTQIQRIKEGGLAPNQQFNAKNVRCTLIKRGVSVGLTEELLADVPQTKNFVNNRLARLLAEDFEAQVVYGGGANSDAHEDSMDGILGGVWESDLSSDANGNKNLGAEDSILTYTGLAADYEIEQILNGVTKLWDAGNTAPTFLAIRFPMLAKLMKTRTSDGEYVWGDAISGAADKVWGIPLLVSQFLPNDSDCLALNVNDLFVLRKGGLQIDYGIVNEDFLKGQRRIRAVYRAQVGIERPSSVLRMTLTDYGAS